MKPCVYVVLLLLCVVGSSSVVQAQDIADKDDSREPIVIGIFAGYNFLDHSLQGTQLQGFPNCCLDFTQHTGTGIALGGLFEFPLTNALRTSLRLGYQNLSTTLVASKSYGKGELNNNVVDINTEQRLAAHLPALTIEPELSYRLFGRLGTHLGIRTAYILSPSYTYEEQIVSGDFIFAETRAKTRHKNEADIPNAKTLLFAGVAGVSYELPVGRNIFAPEIRYVLPLTPLVDDGEWKTSSLHIGAAFKIPLRSSQKLQIIRDSIYQRDTNVIAVQGIREGNIRLKSTSTIVDTLSDQATVTMRYTISQHYVQEIPRNNLSAHVSYVFVNKEGTPLSEDKAVVEEIESVENFPLLPYIFFPEGSSTLAHTRQKLLSQEQAKGFSSNELTPNPIKAYPDFLNIVGARLQQSAQTRITLMGCNNNTDQEKNNTALSLARAEAVKQYLVSVWGIESRRITVKARNLPALPSNGQTKEGQEENQRVEISSQHDAILQPLSIVDAEYVSPVKSVRITPQIVADAGIQSWHVYIEQDGKVLVRLPSSSSLQPISWDIHDTVLPYLASPIHVVLSVTDKAGQEREARQTISMDQLTIQKKRTTQTTDRRIENYQLIMFDFNSAAITAQDRTYLQVLAQSIKQKKDVQIVIRGYTDRTGSTGYNQLLAERRCQETMKILKTTPSNTTIEPIGSSTLLYDNSTPEGRFYSRTVEVKIESPI